MPLLLHLTIRPSVLLLEIWKCGTFGSHQTEEISLHKSQASPFISGMASVSWHLVTKMFGMLSKWVKRRSDTDHDLGINSLTLNNMLHFEEILSLCPHFLSIYKVLFTESPHYILYWFYHDITLFFLTTSSASIRITALWHCYQSWRVW